MVRVRFGGDKWPAAKAPYIELPPETSLQDSIPTILEGLAVTRDVFDEYTLHLVIEKSTGPELDLDETPTSLGLSDGRTIFLKKKRAAAAGKSPAPAGVRPKTVGGAPPPPPPKKSNPSPVKGAPPPPPKKAPAGGAGGPPPPPPKKSPSPGAALRKGPPPPPPKKSSRAPSPRGSISDSDGDGGAAPPPPPPKKSPLAAKGAPPPPPKKGPPGSPASRTGTPTRSDAPPPPPPKKTMMKKAPPKPATAAAPKVPPAPKAPASSSGMDDEATMMMAGNSDDDYDDSSDDDYSDSSNDGGAPPSTNAFGGGNYSAAGLEMTLTVPDNDFRANPVRSPSPQPPPKAAPKASSALKSRPPSPSPQAGGGTKSTPPPPPPKKSLPGAKSPLSPAAKKSTPPPPSSERRGSTSSVSGGNQAPPPLMTPPAAASSHASAPATQQSVSGSVDFTAAFDALRDSNDEKLSNMTSRIEERLELLQKMQDTSRGAKMDNLQHEMQATLKSEIESMRSELSRSWEEQRAAALRQQNDIESQRAEMLRQMVAREEELHKSQAELIHKYQQRAAGQMQGDTALNDLRQLNSELREQLERKRNETNSSSASGADATQIVKLQEQLVNVVTTLSQSGANGSLLNASSPLADGMTPMEMISSSNDGAGGVALRNDQLRRLLMTLGIDKYFAALAEKEIDVHSLLNMDDEELEAAGVKTIGARKRVLLEAQRRKKLNPNRGDIHHSGGAQSGAAAHELVAVSTPLSPVVQHLTTQQRADHIKLLQQTFDVHDPALRDRAESLLDQLGGGGSEEGLKTLYGALGAKYAVAASTYRSILHHFLKQHAPHMLPAVDIICDVHEDREAEYAESIMLKKLAQRSQPATWLLYRTAATPNDEDGSLEAGEFYYNALVEMSQREMPLSLVRRGVAEVNEERFSQSSPTGTNRQLPPNPTVSDDNRSINQLYIAASAALLMIHEPQRLPQMGDMFVKYEHREQTLFLELRDMYATKR